MTHITWNERGERMVDGVLAPEHERRGGWESKTLATKQVPVGQIVADLVELIKAMPLTDQQVLVLKAAIDGRVDNGNRTQGSAVSRGEGAEGEGGTGGNGEGGTDR